MRDGAEYTVSNDYLSLTVASRGAEVVSLQSPEDGTDFIWQGDPRYWEDHSPLLFPAVGDWKDNRYIYKGREYEMPLHGFARNLIFDVRQNENQIICTLTPGEETKNYYPFDFQLTIVYTLDKNVLLTEQYVHNRSDGPMPYSIGEHIGFRVPLLPGERYEDYYIEFDKPETAPRYPLTDGREIGPPVPCLKETRRIDLARDMFEGGAWNFEGLASERAVLGNTRNSCRIILDFPGFSHFSLWSRPEAPYLCMEPCNGMAAGTDEGFDPFQKRGIRILEAGQRDSISYSVTVQTASTDRKLAEAYQQSVIEKRISVRKFRNRVVTREKILRILRYAMTSPTAANNREWEFFVVTDPREREKISKMSPYAGPAREAGVLIIPCMNCEKVRLDKQGNSWWVEDLAACSQTVLLGAKEEGLDGVWLGFYPDEERVGALAEYLQCGSRYVPFSVLALGYAEGERKRKDRFDPDSIHFM